VTGPRRTVFLPMVPQCFERRTCLVEAQHSAAAVSTDFFFFLQFIKHNLVFIFHLFLFDRSSYHSSQNLFVFAFAIEDCKD